MVTGEALMAEAVARFTEIVEPLVQRWICVAQSLTT
jgi:hypothetical protein